MMLLVTRKTVEGTIQRNTRVEEQKKNKKSPKNSIEELSIVGTNLSSSAVSILSCRRPLQHGVGYRRLRWISRLGRGHHHHHHHHHHRWRPMMMMMMMMATMMLRLRPLCAWWWRRFRRSIAASKKKGAVSLFFSPPVSHILGENQFFFGWWFHSLDSNQYQVTSYDL